MLARNIEWTFWSSFGTREKLHLAKTLHFGTTLKKMKNSHLFYVEEPFNITVFLAIWKEALSFGSKCVVLYFSNEIWESFTGKLICHAPSISCGGVGKSFCSIFIIRLWGFLSTRRPRRYSKRSRNVFMECSKTEVLLSTSEFYHKDQKVCVWVSRNFACLERKLDNVHLTLRLS